MGHRFDPKHVAKLLHQDRYALLQPEKLLNVLGLGAHESLADIGCGPGFFSLPAAKRTQGVIYGIDVEPQMLEFLRERAGAEGIENIRTIASDAEQIDLPDASVEKAICAFVLHEVGDLAKTLQEVKRILKPGGTFLVLEWEKKQTESGPPVEERLAAAELQMVMEQAGFATKIEQPNPNHYFILGTL